MLVSQTYKKQVNTPFIIAPPQAARAFYASISGSKQLDPPYDQFHSYPCFNPPKMHFEFSGWNVDIMKGKRGDGRWSPGGAFSLGRKEIGSGYCIGMVIESRWSVAADKMKEKVSGFQLESGNGLEDVWIIGEPFFRDVQVAFDVSNACRQLWQRTNKRVVEGEENRDAENLTMACSISQKQFCQNCSSPNLLPTHSSACITYLPCTDWMVNQAILALYASGPLRKRRLRERIRSFW